MHYGEERDDYFPQSLGEVRDTEEGTRCLSKTSTWFYMSLQLRYESSFHRSYSFIDNSSGFKTIFN